MHGVSKSIHNIENRIGMGNKLPNGWKHRNRVEYSSKIREWSKYKIRYDWRRVKAIRKQSIEQSDESKEKRSEESHEDHQAKMSNRNMCKKQCYTENNRSCNHPTDHPTRDKSSNNHWIGSRGNKDFFDRFLKFCHIKWGNHMGKRIHNDWHHHESWNDKFHIRKSSHLSYTISDKLSKNHVVKSCCDHWRNNRLPPDPKKSLNFLKNNGIIRCKKLWRIHNNEERRYETDDYFCVLLRKNSSSLPLFGFIERILYPSFERICIASSRVHKEEVVRSREVSIIFG